MDNNEPTEALDEQLLGHRFDEWPRPDVTITIPGNLTSPDYLSGLRHLLDATRWSFLVDEIESAAAAPEPEYEYMLRGASPASSPIQFSVPEQEREWLEVIDERVRAMFMRRRKPGEWERF